MKLGIKDISNVYLGSKEIDKIYLGLKEIFTSEVSPNGSPTSLAVVVDSDTQLTVTWVNGATNQDGTYIYYSLDGFTGWQLGATVNGSGTTSVIDNLYLQTKYYWIYAVHFKGNKESLPSNIYTTWMYEHQFAIPINGLNVIQGLNTNMFGDALVALPINNQLSVNYISDKGIQSGNNFTFNDSIDEGNMPLIIEFRNDNYLYLTKNINVKIKKPVIQGSKKILMIGDSLMVGGHVLYGSKIEELLSDVSFTFLGTIGDSYKCEGYAGAAWSSFVSGTHGKFVKSGVLNIPAFFTDYSIDTPDYITIQLGVNDVFTATSLANGADLSDEELSVILFNAKTLIDGFLSFNPNLKIIVFISALCVNDSIGWSHDYDPITHNQDAYIRGSHRYSKAIIDTFSNSIYNQRVLVGYETYFIDRDLGYPKINGIHTGSIHPSDYGYSQIGTSMAAEINNLISDELIVSNVLVEWGQDVLITWDDNSGGTAVFEIYRSLDNSTWNLINTTLVGVENYHDNIIVVQDLYYKIKTVIGTWKSDYSLSTHLDLKPTNLTVDYIDDKAELMWIDNTKGNAVYEIWRSDNGAEYNLIDTTNTCVQVYSDSTSPATNVNFKIRAKIGTWYSAYSNIAELTMNPTGLITSWENNYATIDFTDNTSGVAQHEVYESKNGNDYTLVTTLSAGVTHYHNVTWQNANMSFKVRAKIGTWYSAYSNIVSLTTPLVIQTNQTTLTNVVFTQLNIYAGKTININWGDGTNNNVTGNNFNYTKSYSVTGNYYIIITGDTTQITQLRIQNQLTIFGSIQKWILPVRMTSLILNACGFTGDLTNFDLTNTVIETLQLGTGKFTGNITNWTLPSTLTYIYMPQSSGYGFTGDISNWVIPSNMTYLDLTGSTNKISGDLSGITLPISLVTFYIPGNSITKLPRGAFKGINTVGLNASTNSLNQSEIDNFLGAVYSYYSINPPNKSARFNLSGTGNGKPSASGLALKSSIESLFVSAGFVCTINVNS